MRKEKAVSKYLMIIGVLCTIAVPVMAIVTVMRITKKKSAAQLVNGMMILMILAISAFVLSGMLDRM